MKRIFFLSAFIMALICGMTSCGKRDSSRKVIAVSIPPQAALLRSITGDTIEIVTLMPAEANPETFEVTVKNMRTLSDAPLYMKMGNLPFEETLAERIGESNAGMKFVDVSQGVKLIYGTHAHGAHSHDVADPHTWTSIPNLKIIASNMRDAVVALDPDNKEYYDANYNRLTSRLDSINADIAQRIIASAGSKSFMIWHPSLSYFARDYNLDQIAVGQDNKEMTPGELRDVHQRAANANARVMFMQQNFDSRQAQTLASALDAEIVIINPMDSDYLNQFNIITDAITRH